MCRLEQTRIGEGADKEGRGEKGTRVPSILQTLLQLHFCCSCCNLPRHLTHWLTPRPQSITPTHPIPAPPVPVKENPRASAKDFLDNAQGLKFSFCSSSVPF